MKKGQTSWTLWKGHTHDAEKVAPNATWDGIRLYCLVTDVSGASLKTNPLTVSLSVSG